jgi:peptidoglycan pentaglycine glycine transferase (the first glycine)
MISVKTCTSQAEWDDYILSHDGHPLQLWGWGEVKASHNWQAERVFVQEGTEILGAGQLLIRNLPWPFKALVYLPRGPVAGSSERENVLGELADYARRRYTAVAITVEPDWKDMPQSDGWVASNTTILLPRTLILDLTNTLDTLLMRMTKKTRQYIRKSDNEATVIRRVTSREELQACLEIYKQTASRANFALHDDSYYLDVFDKLGDYSLVMAAFLDAAPVAFLWVALSERTAFELYGGMNDDGQRLRANYALKWQTIQTVKRWGIDRYDLNGLLNDGVSTFKQGFADHEDILAGTYDKPLSPLYRIWAKGVPVGKKLFRMLARHR